jgi:very-short-patch-repair endonuclease
MRAIVRLVARQAGRQHGVVTAGQLLTAGMTRSGIDRWIQSGLLHREFRGVYRLGHRAPNVEARYMAAVLACGTGAVLSGPAAAFHYGLVRRPVPPPEVSAPGDHSVPGIATRRRKVAVQVWHRIPTTTVPQTITDLAATLSLDPLARACHEADVRFGIRDVPARSRPGAAKLRAIYEGDHRLVLSAMERAFLALLRKHGLPLPRTNRRRGAHYVDCRWPEHRLTVELDSFRFHRSRHAWEQDRERERAARRRGDEFRRFTWRDVVEDPLPMLSDLTVLLGFPAKLQ